MDVHSRAEEKSKMSTAAVRPENDLLTFFFQRLSAADERLLILDYDGTVAPFTADRHRALPYPTVPELLDCIMSTCSTRVVLVTGRSAAEIPELLGITPHPEIWGVHGLERLYPDGRQEMGYMSAREVKGLERASAWISQEGLRDQAELKSGAVAVHWRGLPMAAIEELRTRCYRTLAPVACEYNLRLTEFDGGLELRVRSSSKEHAVRALLSEVDIDAPVAYLGDDLTDEDAFRTLSDRGLTVLVRPVFRTTAAQMWLRPPDGLVQFLCDWIRACGAFV
jgi:trehalose 6-phosphate phosphatase